MSHDPPAPAPLSTAAPAGTSAHATRNVIPEVDRARLQVAFEGRYQVGALIGQGQWSAVFRAARVEKKGQVALKLLDVDASASPGLMRRLAALTHATTTLAWDTALVATTLEHHGTTAVLVMPLMEEGSVGDLARSEQLLPVNRVLEIVQEVASALDCLHRGGITHRGLTPENILLDGEGQPRLADVGITDALIAEANAHGARQSRSRAYAAPEQRRSKHVDGRADQYSLAVIAYELLSGRRRLDGEIVAGIQTVPPIEVLADAPLRNDLPLYANAALRRALSANPENRFPTATAFAEALAGRGPGPERGLPTSRADLRLRRRRRAAVGFGAFVMVLTIATIADPQLHAAARDAWRALAAHVNMLSTHVDVSIDPGQVLASAPPAREPGPAAGANSTGPVGPEVPPSRAGATQPISGAGAGTGQAATGKPLDVRLGGSSPNVGRSVNTPNTAPNTAPGTAAGGAPVRSARSWVSRFFSGSWLGRSRLAYIHVDVDRGTAIVTIDGIPRGTAPLTASVGAGHHSVSVHGTVDYTAPSTGITAPSGDTVTVSFHSAPNR